MPSLRFPKAARLSQSSEFSRIRSEGTSFHGKLVVLTVLRVAIDEAPRIGLITSRRVGRAVERNRVRRRLREIIRAVLPQMRRGLWFVIVARAAATRAKFSALQADVMSLAERGAILESACS